MGEAVGTRECCVETGGWEGLPSTKEAAKVQAREESTLWSLRWLPRAWASPKDWSAVVEGRDTREDAGQSDVGGP